MDDAFAACRAVHFASVMLAFGAAAFRVYAFAEGADTLPPGLAAALRRLLLIAGGIALLSALALLPVVGGRMAGSAAEAVDWRTISAVLWQTGFGRVWRWHLLLTACFVAAVAVRPVSPVWRAALAAAMLASLALVGHAAAAPGLLGLGRAANDSVHLLAGGLWLGGLVPLGMLACRARRWSENRAWSDALRQAVMRFSRVAYVAVGLVAASGIVNTMLLVGSVEALLATDYGRLLLVKLALFLLLLAVAVINRLILVPWIDSEEGRWSGAAALSWTVAVEQVLGLAIIAVVSILGMLPPAMHQHVH